MEGKVRLCLKPGTPLPVDLLLKKGGGVKGKAIVRFNPFAEVDAKVAELQMKSYPDRFILLKEGEKVDMSKYPVSAVFQRSELEEVMHKLNAGELMKVLEFAEKLYTARIAAEKTDGPGKEPETPNGRNDDGYEDLTVKDLNAEIEARKAAGRTIEPEGEKKADLIKALRADDKAAE